MKKQMINNARLNQHYIRIKHPSGLTLLLYPMPDYTGAYALFGTKYGSADRSFRKKGEDSYVTVPDGIAHYLEHKLFENESGDAFSLFAKTGASANAFTSFDKTAYLFSCTDHFEKALEILLDFVQHPYFTEASVQKEQGIIGQEIGMYDDDPNWQVLFNCLKSLYQKHPVRVDIAGTTESIAKIDKDLLYRCYHTFYNLHNMALAIAGDFSPDQVVTMVDRLTDTCEDVTVERKNYAEPGEVFRPLAEVKLSVAVPLFCYGFKLPPRAGKQRTSAQVQSDLLLEMLMGETSDLYQELYEEGLINDTFGSETFAGDGYFAWLISGESKEPKKVCERLRQKLLLMQREGMNEEDFRRVKKVLYGNALRMFDRASSIANRMLDSEFSGVSLFDELDLLVSATKEECEAFLALADLSQSSLSVVNPI